MEKEPVRHSYYTSPYYIWQTCCINYVSSCIFFCFVPFLFLNSCEVGMASESQEIWLIYTFFSIAKSEMKQKLSTDELTINNRKSNTTIHVFVIPCSFRYDHTNTYYMAFLVLRHDDVINHVTVVTVNKLLPKTSLRCCVRTHMYGLFYQVWNKLCHRCPLLRR